MPVHTSSHCPAVSFLFNDTATTEIYTLSLHDALPIFGEQVPKIYAINKSEGVARRIARPLELFTRIFNPFVNSSSGDRKSTRLNSSHSQISYAVFCLKKKKTNNTTNLPHHSNNNHGTT